MTTRTKTDGQRKVYSEVAEEDPKRKRKSRPTVVKAPEEGPVPDGEEPEVDVEPDADMKVHGDFYYGRTTFRRICKFYKDKFDASTGNLKDKALSALSKAEMDKRVIAFIIEVFGNKLVNKLSSDHMEDMMSTMYTILFSHRHQKDNDDRYLIETKEHLL